MKDNHFDVIIVGGSYSGLSAAMSLGRALRTVLVLDSGKPCNMQTPYSHNMITQDGERPSIILEKAKAQVLKYSSVKFLNRLAISGTKTGYGFAIFTQNNEEFHARKLLFASGVKDILPDIAGFAACWGISVLHCPYCHGYEIKHKVTGILANGDYAYNFVKLIRNWANDLTVFTNGFSTLTKEQTDSITKHGIPIIEKEIFNLTHQNGLIQDVSFKDGSSLPVAAIYTRTDYKQHCDIPEALGCELTVQGLIKLNSLHQTSVSSIFACGDNVSPMRSVANAISTGNITGAIVNDEIADDDF